MDDSCPPSPLDRFVNPVLSPSPASKRARKYAGTTKAALMGTSLEHLASNLPATSSNTQPQITIPPALHIRRPNFNLIDELPNEGTLSQQHLRQLMKDLRLELDLARLHINELDKTIRTLQVELVIENAHSSRSSYMHGRRKRKRRRRMLPLNWMHQRGVLSHATRLKHMKSDVTRRPFRSRQTRRHGRKTGGGSAVSVRLQTLPGMQ